MGRLVAGAYRVNMMTVRYRILYVDDVIAAIDIDPQGVLKTLEGGMYIGAGHDPEQGTLFLGLIDDVRIYDRLIIP